MRRIWGLFRSTVFLGVLCFGLAGAALSASLWALQAGAAATAASARMAQMATQHKKALVRSKARARVRRAIVATPFVGVAAIAYFENRDYRDWKAENPDGTWEAYLCAMAEATAEAVPIVLEDLPEALRPDEESLKRFLPECAAPAKG